MTLIPTPSNSVGQRHKDCDHMLSGSSANGDKQCVTCGDVFDHFGRFIRTTKLQSTSTGSDELVERLRRSVTDTTAFCPSPVFRNPDGPAAADEIERLRAIATPDTDRRIHELECQKLVLEQFAEAANARIAELEAQIAADTDRVAVLLRAVAPMFPITTRDTPDYAEVHFGSGEGHSSQAMTMNPEHWNALNELFDVLRANAIATPDTDLRAKFAAFVSHATGGHTSDISLPLNTLSVMASQKVNAAWEMALEKGRREATDTDRVAVLERVRAAIEDERRKWFCCGQDCEPFDYGRDEGFDRALKAFDAALSQPLGSRENGNG